MDIEKIIAKEGYVFQRKHDGMIFGNEIYLGIDYSTGTARQDKAEYYEQMRGKKRLFTPMSYKEIVDVQDECLEVVSTEVANDTFDVCEILVKGLLKGD